MTCIDVVGYNSYSSELIPMSEILESEADKNNIHIVEAIEHVFGKGASLDGIKGTWICYKAVDCFRGYVLSASEFYLSDQEVIENYPNFIDEVHVVDLHGLICVIGDPMTGYLYADIRAS